MIKLTYIKEKPTRNFLIVSAFVVFTLALISSLPLFFRISAMYLAPNNFHDFSSFYSVAEGKIRIFHHLVNIAIALPLILFFLLLKLPGAFSRVSILVFSLYSIWITDKNFHVYSDYHINRYPTDAVDISKIWYAYKKLHIYEHREFLDYRSVFSPDFIRTNKIETYADFYAVVLQRYQESRNSLAKAWNTASEEKLKALYFLNQTSWLWAYGNQFALDKAGCVSNNETTNFSINENWSKPSFYLTSPIACCTDYAHMLKFLLDSAGIQNKLVLIPGHIFNEVEIEGQPWVLDATVGYAIPFSWRQISTPGFTAKIDIELFPDKSMQDPKSKDYRPLASRFRLHMLNLIAIGPSVEFTYSDRKPVFLE